jgi:lipopolysaccharide exporter
LTDHPSSHEPEATEGTRSLTSQTLHGLKWTYLATFCSAALQVAVTATMSRLMAPSAYGVMAAAGTFLSFGSYFSQMGVGDAVVQKAELSPENIRAAFAATTGIGMLMALALVVFAPLSRDILNDDTVVPVVRMIALSLVINGLASTSLNLLRRNLRFRVLSIIEVASFGLSYGVVGIPLAIIRPDVWTLTAVFLAQPLLTLCFAYYVVRHDLRPCFRWESHKALLSYGSKISVTGFAEFLFFRADTAIVGRQWGAVALGIYNRAGMLASLPVYNASAAMMKVLFPAFSRAQSDNRRLAGAYLQGVTVLSLVALPLAAGMIAGAGDIVLTSLGSQYKEAIGLVRIFAIAIPLSMAASLAATVCNIKNEIGARFRQQIVLCLLIWAAVWIAARWSIREVAVAAVVVQGLRWIGCQYLAGRSLGIGWLQLGKAARPGVELAVLVTIAVSVAARVNSLQASWAHLILEIGSAALVCICYCLWLPPVQLTPLLLRALDS